VFNCIDGGVIADAEGPYVGVTLWRGGSVDDDNGNDDDEEEEEEDEEWDCALMTEDGM